MRNHVPDAMKIAKHHANYFLRTIILLNSTLNRNVLRTYGKPPFRKEKAIEIQYLPLKISLVVTKYN